MINVNLPQVSNYTPIAQPQSLLHLAPDTGSAVKDFYSKYETPVHVGGGALLGAGIARLAGAPGELILSAAGTGAFAGWMARNPKQAMVMAGGAAIGAAVASLAGLPGAAVVSAAGTGTFVGWLVA